MKEKLLKVLRWFFASYIWLGIILLAADIISKNAIILNQDNIGPDGVVLIPGFLRVNYLINKNVVFGWDVFKNATANRAVFIVVALLVVAGLIFFLIKKWDKLNKFYKACIMMIIAGALGNTIDRIFYSISYLNYIDPKTGQYITGVVDWIDFYGVWSFNFNIADSAVVVAAFMLIIYMIVVDIMDYRKKAKAAPKKKIDNEKVLSKSEQEKNSYLESKDE